MSSGQDWLPAFVASQMERKASRSRIDADEVAHAGGIRLYGTIGGEGILKPDGSIWFYELTSTTPEQYGWRRANFLERIGVIVFGIKHFPELKRLLPDRPMGEPDCHACGGTGNVLKDFQCSTCAGLGWVPEEVA